MLYNKFKRREELPKSTQFLSKEFQTKIIWALPSQFNMKNYPQYQSFFIIYNKSFNEIRTEKIIQLQKIYFAIQGLEKDFKNAHTLKQIRAKNWSCFSLYQDAIDILFNAK